MMSQPEARLDLRDPQVNLRTLVSIYMDFEMKDEYKEISCIQMK